jgi:hypothetical protein
MSKYEELDAAILKDIKNGPNDIWGLETSRRIASPLTKEKGYFHVTELLSRRLQALRKAGKVTYKKGRWHIEGKA